MKFLNDLTIQQIVARGGAYLLLAALLGGLIAVCAGRRGRGVRPVEAVSLAGLAMAVLFQLGWLRPVPVPGPRRAAAAAAAVAGPVLLIALADILRPYLGQWALGPGGRFGLIFVREFQVMAAAMWALALVPVPPLPGGYLLAAVAPRLHAVLERRQAALSVALVVAIVAGWLPALGTRALPLLSLEGR